jgi:HSP20 family protein
MPDLFSDLGFGMFHRGLDLLGGEASPCARGFAVDVREDSSRYVIEANLPGVSKEHLELDFEGDVLTIQARHNAEHADKGEGYHVRERRCGAVSRQFQLPEAVDRDRIEAELKNGVLTVTVPKAESAKPKKIAVSGD